MARIARVEMRAIGEAPPDRQDERSHIVVVLDAAGVELDQIQFRDRADATAFADLGAVSAWLGLGDAVIPALEVATGALANNVRNLS